MQCSAVQQRSAVQYSSAIQCSSELRFIVQCSTFQYNTQCTLQSTGAQSTDTKKLHSPPLNLEDTKKSMFYQIFRTGRGGT